MNNSDPKSTQNNETVETVEAVKLRFREAVTGIAKAFEGFPNGIERWKEYEQALIEVIDADPNKPDSVILSSNKNNNNPQQFILWVSSKGQKIFAEFKDRSKFMEWELTSTEAREISAALIKFADYVSKFEVPL